MQKTQKISASGGRSPAGGIKPLIFGKIGAEGAEIFLGFWSIQLPFYPPLKIPLFVIRGGKTVTISSDHNSAVQVGPESVKLTSRKLDWTLERGSC